MTTMTIKEVRMKYCLTQQRVSEITGVPRRSIQNWETGIRKCPDYVEKMIVAMLDCEFEQNRMYLNVLLKLLKRDLDNVYSDETKDYIKTIISSISNHLNK